VPGTHGNQEAAKREADEMMMRQRARERGNTVGGGQRVAARTLAMALAMAVWVGGCSSGTDESADEPTTAAAPAAGGPDTPARPSSGCEAPDAAFATTTDGTIRSGGVDRQYKLVAPTDSARTEPLPLVLTIHGGGSGKDIIANITQLGALAQQEGFVAVFPHGLGQPPAWDYTADGTDVAYLNDLLDTVESKLCIDTTREYVTGFSAGAAMTTLLTCTDSQRFAAAAPVAGASEFDSCEPSEEMPVTVFHGTDDPFVLFEGGVGEGIEPPEGAIVGPSTTEVVAAWAERNGCSGESTESNPAEGARLVSYDCPAGADVEFYILERAGHTWPGSEFHAALESVLGPTNMNVDATATMWAFFQQHARP
jgi:polyhydroxybutyrate depolymerase